MDVGTRDETPRSTSRRGAWRVARTWNRTLENENTVGAHTLGPRVEAYRVSPECACG